MSKPSTAYRIFHDPWLCAIPEIHCYSRTYLEEAGLPTTGDKAMDVALMQAKRDMYLTIAAMVIHHEEGTPLTLKNAKDAVEIYRLLMEHLETWKNIINTVYNVTVPPAEDFMMMDNFAKAIHPLVLAVNDNALPMQGLFAKLLTIQGKHSAFVRGSMFERKTQTPPVEGEQIAPDPNIHRPIADDIARRLWRKPS